MDDANAPSLASLAYLGCLRDDESRLVFRNTKRLVYSAANPFYFEGKASGLAGVGSLHVGYGMIWPLSIIYDLFDDDKADWEVLHGLEKLKRSAAGTQCMHESFWMDDPSVYTRPWFAWANSAFGELVLHLLKTRPHLLLKTNVTST